MLHSDVPPDAPADEQDTLITARAVAEALRSRGHWASLAPNVFDPEKLLSAIAEHRPDMVFNMVEAIFGQGELAPAVPALLEKLTVPYTGCGAAAMALAGDKPLSKKVLQLAGLPTPDWHEWPFTQMPNSDARYIVKSATEDASFGLDAGAVVTGANAVRQRAQRCRSEYGGRWFAEAYVEGREFNISVLEEDGEPRVLPIAEMVFHAWPSERPRIVGYDAKWSEASPEYSGAERRFHREGTESELHQRLTGLCKAAWRLFNLRGYARLDFRVSEAGEPFVLEINPNPGLEPGAGFAAAAAQAGMSYAEVIEHIVICALPNLTR
ncbi:MAG: ATP-grasp domain-containing protein [Sinobacteraceae bacterium]|nr:ATP-grasp domain-containing protein [Nevskiaceae bacterium]